MALAVALGWWSRAPEVSTDGDEATYVLLSQSLDQGRYHNEFALGTPRHAKYPPGNAIWIASIRQLAGPDLEAVRALNILLLALTGLLLGDGVRRLAGPWPGVAGVALTALSPPLLELSGTALSEAPYAFLATAGLWSALNSDEQGGGRWAFVAMAAALASFLTRSIGFTTVAGILAWLVYRKRWRAAITFAMLALAVIGAWFAYSKHAGKAGLVATYGDDLGHVASQGPGGMTALLGQVVTNAEQYLVRTLPHSISLPSIPGTLIDNLLALVLVGGSTLIGLFVLARRWPAMAGYLVLYCGVLLIWPWAVERLLAPLVPAIVAAFVVGCWTASRVAGARARAWVPMILSIAICATDVAFYVRQDRNHRCDRRDPFADRRCFFEGARSLVAAARLIGNNAPAAAVVATAKQSPVFYFSRHLTVGLASVLREEQRSGALNLRSQGVDFVLLGSLMSVERTAGTMLLRHCEDLTVYASIPPSTLLITARNDRSSQGDACGALTGYARALADQ